MEDWLTFLGGMTVMCGCVAILAAVGDWLQRVLDKWNELNDEQQENEQLNNQE